VCICERISLDEVAREPIFASEEKMVSSLLTEMKGRQMHMAIVIDELCGVEGLVTLEDLIEEIVGEIRDETDVDKHQEFHALDKNTIITNGDIEIDKINEIFKTNIPQGEDYASLNGLLHEKLRDIPHEGDKVEVDSLGLL
jgi:CBS domain containing-hemolysin-like protein